MSWSLSILHGLLFSLWLLSILVLVSFHPSVFTLLYKNLGFSASYLHHAHNIMEMMWNDLPFRELPYLNSVLHEKEIEHFEDIRSIRLVLFGSSLTFTILALPLLDLIPWKAILMRALFSTLIIGGALATWGTLNWRHMFRTLHWWFFRDDSWILPHGCVTLQLFPYKVWQTLGITIGGTHLILLFLAYFLSQRLLKS